MADYQKNQVYLAESWVTAGNRNFMSEKEAAQFIRFCERDVRFKQRWPGYTPVTIRRVSGATVWKQEAWYQPGNHSIYLPFFGWNSKSLVHELAHGVTHKCEAHDGGGHGIPFARTYLELTRLFLGETAYTQLLAGFDACSVRIAYAHERS